MCSTNDANDAWSQSRVAAGNGLHQGKRVTRHGRFAQQNAGGLSPSTNGSLIGLARLAGEGVQRMTRMTRMTHGLRAVSSLGTGMDNGKRVMPRASSFVSFFLFDLFEPE
jgi:hypothetical protein